MGGAEAGFDEKGDAGASGGGEAREEGEGKGREERRERKGRRTGPRLRPARGCAPPPRGQTSANSHQHCKW